jgi:hypothetical protein
MLQRAASMAAVSARRLPWPLFRPLPLFQRVADIEDWPFVFHFRDLYSPMCAKTVYKLKKTIHYHTL